MNVIYVTKPSGSRWNRLLDAVVKLWTIRKNTVYHAICNKLFSGGTVPYPMVYTDDVLNNNNNKTAITELGKLFEEAFEIKFQGGYVLKYLNFRIFQSPLGFSIDQTDHIMKLVNEWFPTGKFIKIRYTVLDRLHI